MKKITKSAVWFVLLVSLGVTSRWMPHPPNFTALLAVALFAGIVLPGPVALVVPILSAFLCDLFLGFHDGVWFVYISLIPLVFMGLKMPMFTNKPKNWLKWGAWGMAGTISFFITTNLAVWWLSGMYPLSAEGLMTCFALAIPFFHNSIAATFIYLASLQATQVVFARAPWFATADCARATSSASPK